MDELPMAVAAGCGLDPAGLAEQASRYERLGAMADAVQRLPNGLRVSFGPAVDRSLLAETAAVERDCCGFLTVDLDHSANLIVIGADAHGAPVLDAIQRWLESGQAAAGRGAGSDRPAQAGGG